MGFFMIRKNFFIKLLTFLIVIAGLCAGDNPEIGNVDSVVITVKNRGRSCFLMARFRMPEDRSYARKFYNLGPKTTMTIELAGNRQKLEGITVFVPIGDHYLSVNAPIAPYYDVMCTEDGIQVTPL